MNITNTTQDLKDALNIPFDITINDKKYILKRFNTLQFFRLADLIIEERIKDKLKSSLEFLTPDEKIKLLKDLSKEARQVNLLNIGEVLKDVIGNLDINTIYSIIAFAISVFNKKEYNEIRKEVILYTESQDENIIKEYSDIIVKLFSLNVEVSEEDTKKK